MIHALFDLLGVVVDVAAVWLKQDLGAADYRIVRLVFFSALGAWIALELVRATSRVAHIATHLVTVNVPAGLYRMAGQVGRAIESACDRFEQQYRGWLATRKR
jgi:hypothetical protein